MCHSSMKTGLCQGRTLGLIVINPATKLFPSKVVGLIVKFPPLIRRPWNNGLVTPLQQETRSVHVFFCRWYGYSTHPVWRKYLLHRRRIYIVKLIFVVLSALCLTRRSLSELVSQFHFALVNISSLSCRWQLPTAVEVSILCGFTSTQLDRFTLKFLKEVFLL